MALYPNAAWVPLGRQTQPAMSGHDVIVLHTMVGYLKSTDTYFRQSGYTGDEAHFGVGGAWGSDVAADLDGRVYQWQDLGHTADAQMGGNPYCLSIETADNAPAQPSGLAPWTRAQLDSLAHLIAWLCQASTHDECPASWSCHGRGIPAALIPNTKRGVRGVGYHAQGTPPPDGKLVAGGVKWSNSHVCPGPARVAQIPGLLAVVGGLLAGPTPVPVPAPAPAPPAPPAPAPAPPAPPFPLPAGDYFGPEAGPAASVSGWHSHNGDLRTWQARMAQRGWGIAVDGLYGPRGASTPQGQTATVAREFQRQIGVTQDALIGPVTWRAAWTAPITPTLHHSA